MLTMVPLSSLAYEEASVMSGGSIVGKATLTGEIPPPPVYPTYLFPFGSYCEKIADENGNITIEEFYVGPGRSLQDAIIAVQEVKKGKPFEEIKEEFVATDCMFHPANVPPEEMVEMDSMGQVRHVHPLVSVIRNHQRISVVNHDPIFHNVQVFQKERGNIMLNFPLPVSTKARGGVLHFDRGKKIAQMVCGMHEFMQTWSWVVDNPYYAKTKKDGKFSIDQLPPGTYKVLGWHPRLKPIIKEVTVPANGTVEIDFQFDVSRFKRRTYETIKGSRTFK